MVVVQTRPGRCTIDIDTVMKLLAIAIYAGILLLIGYLASKRMHTIRDYFASGKLEVAGAGSRSEQSTPHPWRIPPLKSPS